MEEKEMIFEITRTSSCSEKPCEEARKFKATYLDYRDVATIEEAKKCHWFKDWFNWGTNHREEKGMIVCDRKEKSNIWIVEINSFKELLDLVNKHDEFVISKADYKEVHLELEIYDDYRE